MKCNERQTENTAVSVPTLVWALMKRKRIIILLKPFLALAKNSSMQRGVFWNKDVLADISHLMSSSPVRSSANTRVRIKCRRMLNS